MTNTTMDARPLFRASRTISVDAAASKAYELVAALENSSLWSPECRGGTWIGPPGQVGSIFRGENYRATEVVGWAPLVRGTWTTEAIVTAAEPGVTFQWAMLTHSGVAQKSVWGFDVEPVEDGCQLRHHFEMMEPTQGIHTIVADLDKAARARFITEWTAKLNSDIEVTLERIKDLLEQRSPLDVEGVGATSGGVRA